MLFSQMRIGNIRGLQEEVLLECLVKNIYGVGAWIFYLPRWQLPAELGK